MDQAKQNEIAEAIRAAFDKITDKTNPKQRSVELYMHHENLIGKLLIEFGCGEYHLNNQSTVVHHLMITYLSLECTGDEQGGEAWFTNQSQYFHPSHLEAAIDTYLKRLTSPCMYRAHGSDDNSIDYVNSIEQAQKTN